MIRLGLFGLAIALATAALMVFLFDRAQVAQQEDAVVLVEQAPPPDVWVLVALRELPARHQVAGGDIGWTEWPEARVQPFFTVSENGDADPVELNGLFTSRSFSPGEPLDLGALTTVRVERLSDRVAPGKRAVALAVSAETTAGGFVKVDDYVDIIRVGAGARDGSVILENVRVLAVGASMGNLAGIDSTAVPDTVGSNPGTVTVELTPQQANTLAAAGFEGRLALALRTRADNDPISDALDPTGNPRHSIGVLQGDTWVPYQVQ